VVRIKWLDYGLIKGIINTTLDCFVWHFIYFYFFVCFLVMVIDKFFPVCDMGNDNRV
jgi:hypothetical protein